MRIDEALQNRPDGVVRVQGFLLQHGGDLQLCAELLESFPPQCGDPSLIVRGLDIETIPDLERGEGAAWTSRQVEVAGTLEGDVLTATAAEG